MKHIPSLYICFTTSLHLEKGFLLVKLFIQPQCSSIVISDRNSYIPAFPAFFYLPTNIKTLRKSCSMYTLQRSYSKMCDSYCNFMQKYPIKTYRSFFFNFIQNICKTFILKNLCFLDFVSGYVLLAFCILLKYF